MKRLLYACAAILALVAAIPLPWRLRRAWYASIDSAVSLFLGWFPGIYDMLADDSRRYGMGKQGKGQMESFKALELVIQELDRTRTAPQIVARAYFSLKQAGTPSEKIPYELANELLEQPARDRILKHLRAL